MAEHGCPKCGAAVAVDDAHCTNCGWLLEWQDVDHETGPRASQGEGQTGDADRETQPVDRSPAATSSSASTPDVAPPVWCQTCGAANLAGRTLCERCGMGLATDDSIMHESTPWWRGRRLRMLLLGAVILGGIVAGLLVFDNLSVDPAAPAADGQGDRGAASAAPSAAATSPPPAGPTVVLRPGASGQEVQQWQQLLQDAGLDVSVDGQFGPGTEQVTADFQRAIGEEPTGQVTSRTLAAAESGSSLRRVRIFLLRDGELEGVRRLVDRTQLARGAVEMLIAAPLQAERDDGLSSAIPSTTSVVGVRVDGGVAEISLTGFAAEPDEASLGPRVQQVIATLTRFNSVDEVRFRLPPDEATVFSDAGVVLVDTPDGGQ